MAESTTAAQRRRVYERLSVALVVSGAILAAVGTVGLAFPRYAPVGLTTGASAAGVVLAIAGLQVSHPLRVFRTLHLETTGGAKYDELRTWTRLKVASILLNLLTVVGGLILLGALLQRAGVFDVPALDLPGAASFAIVLAVILLLTTMQSFLYSARMRQAKPVTGLETSYFHLASASAVLFAALVALLARGDLNLGGGILVRQADAGWYALGAATLVSVAAFVTRSLPSVYALFTKERDFYTGKTYLSAKKSIVMPAMIAFALLFVVLLVALVFQVGVVGLFSGVERNVLLVSVMGIFVVMLAVTVGLSFVLSRSADEAKLFRRAASKERRQELLILGVSATVTAALLGVALYLGLGNDMEPLNLESGNWIDFVAIAMLVAVGPMGFWQARRVKRVRRLEERFPDFLRDLASSRKAGLTMEAGVRIASKGEYGELTPEIYKMAEQLSWNTPFQEALQRFGDRVNTPLINRAVSIIVEAGRTGGHVTDVLMAAAVDAREIKNLETERRQNMSLYSIIVYITFGVFLLVAAVLYSSFLPHMVGAGAAAASTGSTQVGGLSLNQVSLEEFRHFFFMSALMQGLGNGIVAGMMDSGRAVMGLRHAFVLTLITYIVFAFMI